MVMAAAGTGKAGVTPYAFPRETLIPAAEFRMMFCRKAAPATTSILGSHRPPLRATHRRTT